jgi:hypothetical protein
VVTGGVTSLADIVNLISRQLVSAIVTLLMGAAMAVFFLGVVKYLWGVRDGDQTKIKEGNKFLLWGLIALFVMFSIWGIIKLFQNILLNGQNTQSIVIPRFQIDGGGTNTTPCPVVGQARNAAGQCVTP